MSNITTSGPTASRTPARPVTRAFRETKAAFTTTEFWVFVVVSVAILIAAAVTDNGDDGQGFGAATAWSYVAFLAVGYVISRGIAKAGTKARTRDDAAL